jgi:hypothetical protein
MKKLFSSLGDAVWHRLPTRSAKVAHRVTPAFVALTLWATFVVATSANAQIIQSGNVTPGHGYCVATNGVAQDCGTAGNGAINSLGVTASGTPFCINDAVATGAYHQLCLGANSLGGGLLSYNAYGGAASLPMQIDINGTTTTIGTGTINTGTAGNLGVYSAANTISGGTYANLSTGSLTLGLGGSITGKLLLGGSTSGTVTITPQAAAGTFEFDLPTTAGTVGQALVSGGGAGSPMTWATFGGTITSGTLGQTPFYTGTGTTVAGSSALILTTTTANMSPSGAATISPGTTLSIAPTGAMTINPATLSTLDNVTIGATTKAAGSFTTILGTGQISTGVAGASIGSLALSGNTSGTVIVKPQAAAGSYNFNLPITAGTAGQPMLSAAGGASPMTWGTLAGNTTTFATTSGALTNGHAATFDASGNIIDGGALPTGVINSGSTGQITYYAGNGTTVSGNANLTISSGAVTFGVAGATAGSLLLSGSSTGTITLKGSTTTIGTYNFNLPVTAGTSGQPMLSGGGSASAMTWGTVSGNTTKFSTVTGSFTNGDCIAADASGNLIDNGSACGSGGSGTVTSSTAGQIAYYAASNNSVAGNSSLTISGGALTVGVPTTTLGTVGFSGSTSGTVTVKPQAAAGTYNFNLPITAGTAGQVLTSQGGGSTAMTWASPGTAWGSGETVNFNAASNTSYCIDTATSGALTMTLPAAPADGDQVQFTDCKSNFATANLTVARNGNNIMGLAQNMTVDTSNASATLRYWSTTTDWRLQ